MLKNQNKIQKQKQNQRQKQKQIQKLKEIEKEEVERKRYVNTLANEFISNFNKSHLNVEGKMTPKQWARLNNVARVALKYDGYFVECKGKDGIIRVETEAQKEKLERVAMEAFVNFIEMYYVDEEPGGVYLDDYYYDNEGTVKQYIRGARTRVRMNE